MRSNVEIIRHQMKEHSLISTDGFRSVEEYGMHLLHLKAYEEAGRMAAGKRVLDCGCNVGYGTKMLNDAFEMSVVGVDVSVKAIEEARRRYGSTGIEFYVGDGVRLPFEDEQFDLVVSFQVIEHIGDYDPYLSEIKRVLRPRGSAVFTTPNAAIRLEPGMKPWYPLHVREFTASELEGLLSKYFSHVKVLGLFGTGGMHAMIRNRYLRAKEANRRWWGLRRKLKFMIPYRIVEKLRIASAIIGGRILSEQELGEYSTANLFYPEEELEDALDLMAICSNCPSQ